MPRGLGSVFMNIHCVASLISHCTFYPREALFPASQGMKDPSNLPTHTQDLPQPSPLSMLFLCRCCTHYLPATVCRFILDTGVHVPHHTHYDPSPCTISVSPTILLPFCPQHPHPCVDFQRLSSELL